MLKLILTLTLLTSTAFAEMIDESKLMDPTMVSEFNERIKTFEKNHRNNLKILIVNNFGNATRDYYAKDRFKKFNLDYDDILYVVSLEEKQSRFWLGDNVQSYYTKADTQVTHRSMLHFYNQKEYGKAFDIILKDLDIALQGVDFKKPPSSAALWKLALFLGICIAFFTFIGPVGRYTSLKTKYPHLSYKKAQHREKLEETKKNMRRFLKENFPEETLYSSYRRMAKEYKRNRATNTIVNNRGQHSDFADLALTGSLPLYLLMYNSYYTPMDFRQARANNDGSSSGCGVISSCSSGGGEGDSGGGCGGGGCGGCGS